MKLLSNVMKHLIKTNYTIRTFLYTCQFIKEIFLQKAKMILP